jgi:hypothetical protein
MFPLGHPRKFRGVTLIRTLPVDSGLFTVLYITLTLHAIQSVSGGKVNIVGGNSIGHSKQKSIYVHVLYSERFP